MACDSWPSAEDLGKGGLRTGAAMQILIPLRTIRCNGNTESGLVTITALGGAIWLTRP
ncbi:hypothetical protein NEUTE1DRAFT_116197 [Neurospora tetrasperma FGSC 2508]|uniref:Uncharacterized protein n=1 Tax=Neurospora tetrasperma (strain FGSC 2508 / ATCC MYA-4615 / P0657) TaxID=510951 RepID=F8MFZ2_NEUT8|nr:uncharacterized protein NEUTE1DRAFT_116197 [Neurospora tetrasperma FGSC 2508]EGO58520.1 hypothetical protein NEUTE1DRAFT_116197 [Neurospora tetrasperma FGSC 2508]EGZ72586.1 hypothetical protein NEUTE2DRAFT_143892 [Neurospora tetrasperma FGSC 2509]